MVKLAISSEYSEYGDLRLTGSRLPLYIRSLISPVVVWLSGLEERIQRFAQRREPQAVIDQLRVIERQPLLVVQQASIQRERFELAVRRHE